jgi:hypothetical protein
VEIFFSCLDKAVVENFPVFPASANIPKWYSSLPLEMGKEKRFFKEGTENSTIRRCVPFLDAITAGYIVPLPYDIFVTREKFVSEKGEELDLPFYSSNGPGVNFHSPEQAKDHPMNKKNKPIAKIMSPWSVKTPSGYSCAFLPPLNGKESPIEIMSGIVDTDKYDNPVNFPFNLIDENFEGLIPAGTPVAQVIPFKRESWKMKFGSEEDFAESRITFSKLKMKIFDSYRSQFWSKKEFR